MDIWISKSNPMKQILLALGCAAAGLVLAVGFRDFGNWGSNAWAGFLLGLLLLVIGAAGVLVGGKQTVIVNPHRRCITVEDLSCFGLKRRVIVFSDVVSISIGYLGEKSNHVMFYYLALKLKSGEEYPLFSPGRYFEGGSNRSVVETWKRRLEEYLEQSQ